MANKPRGTLYVGVTSSLGRRIWQHKNKELEGFTKQYGLDCLVLFEEFRDVRNAIDREKQIKGWLRIKKIQLIESINPTWRDLSADWNPTDKDNLLTPWRRVTAMDSSLRSE